MTDLTLYIIVEVLNVIGVVMAITYKGVHHRSPSGMHNKVKWILSECKWDLDKFSTLEKEMRTNGEKYTNHLTEAFDIARYILYCGDIRTLPSIFFEKYHWIERECENYVQRKTSDSFLGDTLF